MSGKASALKVGQVVRLSRVPSRYLIATVTKDYVGGFALSVDGRKLGTFAIKTVAMQRYLDEGATVHDA